MANLAGILKDEIRRLARKEIRAEIGATKKASAQYRREIASLKRQLRDQTREIAALKRANRRENAKHGESTDGSVRFSPVWLRSHREKLGLSAADYATLVGVSTQTVYNWEKGKTRPQPPQLAVWAEVRGLGKREAWRRLDELG